MSWTVKDLRYRHPGSDRFAINGISLEIAPGTFTAVIGPNGAGKSSLLNLLLGLRKPAEGSIRFKDQLLSSWPRAQLAKEVGVVAQSEEISFPLTAYDMVAMGRYPHLGPWKREGKSDLKIIESAMETCDVTRFASRDVNSLSGGERQRVRIARALAQQPHTLALDEPTAALDVAHEMATFELLRNLSNKGMTVVLITHHINLAARYADTLAVLHNGRIAAVGQPDTVLTASLVEDVWKWPVIITSHPGLGSDNGAPQVTPLAINSTIHHNHETPGSVR